MPLIITNINRRQGDCLLAINNTNSCQCEYLQTLLAITNINRRRGDCPQTLLVITNTNPCQCEYPQALLLQITSISRRQGDCLRTCLVITSTNSKHHRGESLQERSMIVNRGANFRRRRSKYSMTDARIVPRFVTSESENTVSRCNIPFCDYRVHLES